MALMFSAAILLVTNLVLAVQESDLYPSSVILPAYGRDITRGETPLTTNIVIGKTTVNYFKRVGRLGEGVEFSGPDDAVVSVGFFTLSFQPVARQRLTVIESNDPTLIQKARNDLKYEDGDFLPSSLVVITQENLVLTVQCKDGIRAAVAGNTFQAVLASNGTTAYGIFYFPEDALPYFQEISHVCSSEVISEDNAVLISIAFIDRDGRSAVSLVNIRAGETRLLRKIPSNTNTHQPGVYVMKMTGFMDELCTCLRGDECGEFPETNCFCVLKYGPPVCIPKPFRGFVVEDVSPFNVKLCFIDEEHQVGKSIYDARCSTAAGQASNTMSELEDEGHRVTFELTGLLPSTEYLCTLTRNLNGARRELQLTVVTMDAELYPPVITEFAGFSPQGVFLRWSDDGVLTQHYQIRVEQEMLGTTTFMTADAVSQYTVHNLEPFTVYVLSVAAVHDVLGVGPLSEPVVVTTKSFPCVSFSSVVFRPYNFTKQGSAEFDVMVYHPTDLSGLKDTIFMQLATKNVKLNATVYNTKGVLQSDAVTRDNIAIPLREQESWKKITIRFSSDRGTDLPRCIPVSLSRLAREVRSFDQRDLVCRFRSLSNTKALLHLQQDSSGDDKRCVSDIQEPEEICSNNSVVGIAFIHKIASTDHCRITYTISIWKSFKGNPSLSKRLNFDVLIQDHCPPPQLDSKRLYMIGGEINDSYIVANEQGGVWELNDHIEEQVAIECAKSST